MIDLKNKYSGAAALIIFGGPSIIENRFPLKLIDKRKYVVFLEAKSLTPYFLKSGLVPDYYLMFYPEKCKSNSFQHVVFQSFLAGIDLTGLIKDDFIPEYMHIKDNFDRFFELWKPERGPHKKYRYKPQACFKGSPFDLLSRMPEAGLISCEKAFNNAVAEFPYPNTVYKFDEEPADREFDLEDYFNPSSSGERLVIKDYRFLNSAAIALFPILNFMGFKKIFFLGMDMSMLGSMEYASCYTFKTMRHFGKFFKKARPVFNAAFKENRKKFMRPPYEFEALNSILKYKKADFINIFEPFKYAQKIDGIKNISYSDFLRERYE